MLVRCCTRRVKVGQRFICEWCQSAIRNVVAVAKFVQVLYLFRHVNFCRTFISSISLLGASWFQLSTCTTQPSQSSMELVIFVKYACKCQKVAALRIESFPCNHSTDAVLTGFNSTRQRIRVKFKTNRI